MSREEVAFTGWNKCPEKGFLQQLLSISDLCIYLKRNLSESHILCLLCLSQRCNAAAAPGLPPHRPAGEAGGRLPAWCLHQWRGRLHVPLCQGVPLFNNNKDQKEGVDVHFCRTRIVMLPLVQQSERSFDPMATGNHFFIWWIGGILYIFLMHIVIWLSFSCRRPITFPSCSSTTATSSRDVTWK